MMAARTVVVPTGPGGSPQAVELHDASRLSGRGLFLAWVLTLAILIVGLAALAAAGAAPLTGARRASSTTSSDSSQAATAETSAGTAASSVGEGSSGASRVTAIPDAIHAKWDGGTTHLDWEGRTYVTAEASFVGVRAASPGDRVERTLDIGNDGPGRAVLRISLVLDETKPAGTANTSLGDAVELFWNVGGVSGQQAFNELLVDGNQPAVAEVEVPQNTTIPVVVGYTIPVETTSARSDGSASTVLDFDVVARLQGETTAVAPHRLAMTGANVLLLALVALGIVGLGLLLWGAARRRSKLCDDCGCSVRHDARSWVEHRGERSERWVRCDACYAALVPSSAVTAPPDAALQSVG